MTHDGGLGPHRDGISSSKASGEALKQGNFNPRMRAYYRTLLERYPSEEVTRDERALIRQQVQLLFATKAERAEHKSFREIPAQYALTAVRAQRSLLVMRELLVDEGVRGANIEEANVALCLFCATCGYTAQGRWHSSDFNFLMRKVGGIEGAERSSFIRAYKGTRDEGGGVLPTTPSQFVAFQNRMAARIKSDPLAPKGADYEVRELAIWFGPIDYFKRDDLPLMMYSGDAPRTKTLGRFFDQILLHPQSVLFAELRELAEASHFSARFDERQSTLRKLLTLHQPIKQIEHCTQLASIVLGTLFSTVPQWEIFGATRLASNRTTDSRNRNVAHSLERFHGPLASIVSMDAETLKRASGVSSAFRGDAAYLQDVAIGKLVFRDRAEYLSEIASSVRQHCGTLEDNTRFDGRGAVDLSRREYKDADGVLHLGGNVLEWFRNEALIVELVNTLPSYNRQFSRRLFREVGYLLRTKYFTASSAPPTSKDRPS